VLSELADLGIRVEDVSVLYRQIDTDGSGDLSIDEMLHAFAALHSQMRELERAVTYLRGAFVKADRNGSGTLDFDEFRTMLSKPGALKKLESMGIVTDEVDSLFEEVLLETRGYRGVLDDVFEEAGLGEPAEVTADQLVAAFLKIRDPARLGDRGFAFLRSVFQEADDDGDGALSRAEIKEVLDSDRVARKLEQLGLPVPDWLAIHDELDADGDGCLSWEELQEGIGALWAAEIEKRQRSAQATSFAAKDLRRDAFL
jgi:Ca2+-binding EF-hand superfamily protein